MKNLKLLKQKRIANPSAIGKFKNIHESKLTPSVGIQDENLSAEILNVANKIPILDANISNNDIPAGGIGVS